MIGKEIDVAILCGGRGERMGELCKNKQKCLLEVDGKPVLSHIFDNIITAFGSAHVVLATGYRGQDIKDFYGGKYGKIEISYVGDPRSLETKRRLLLAKDHLKSSFLFLAGDVTCDPQQLLKVIELQEQEKNFIYGTISGASRHEPAFTHALITLQNNHAVHITFPPTPTWNPEQFREMHVACYTPKFLGLLEESPKDILHISKVIAIALEADKNFQASNYFKNWYHFTGPKDLEVTINSFW